MDIVIRAAYLKEPYSRFSTNVLTQNITQFKHWQIHGD